MPKTGELAFPHAYWDQSPEARRVEALKLRSAGEWARLYDDYYVKIRRYAWGRLHSNTGAEDVAATVFLRALGAIDSFQFRGKPVIAWLYKIAENVIKEQQRQLQKESRNKPLMDAGMPADSLAVADAAEHPENWIRHLDLLNAIERLTKEQRSVITLIYVSGFSVREVAQILGKSERAVYYVQARGLMQLKHRLT